MCGWCVRAELQSVRPIGWYFPTDWNTGDYPPFHPRFRHAILSNGKPIDYTTAFLSLRPFANWFIIIAASKWPVRAVRWCMRHFTRARARVLARSSSLGLVVRERVRLRVYFTNNPPVSSRDKSFFEFYLVIEFPPSLPSRPIFHPPDGNYVTLTCGNVNVGERQLGGELML